MTVNVELFLESRENQSHINGQSSNENKINIQAKLDVLEISFFIASLPLVEARKMMKSCDPQKTHHMQYSLTWNMPVN